MINYNDKITQENYEEAYSFLSKETSLLTTYRLMEKNFSSDDKLVKDYHPSLFIYNMIKDKIEINEFDTLIKYIYENNYVNKAGVDILELNLNKFFNSKDFEINSDFEISLKEYLDEVTGLTQPKNKKITVWQHIIYCFIELKNNHPHIREDRIAYLQSMCKLIDKDNIKCLYNSNFVMYLYNFLSDFNNLVPSDFNSLKPLFKTISENEIFNHTEECYYVPLFYALLLHTSNGLYCVGNKEKEIIYKGFESSIENFESIYLSTLFKKNKENEPNKLVFNNGILNLFSFTNQEKVLNFINEKYIDHINKSVKDKRNTSIVDIEHIYKDAMREIDGTFSIYLKQIEFNINPNKIDINKTMVDNIVYIKALTMSLKNGVLEEIPDEIIIYLKNEIQKDKDLLGTSSYWKNKSYDYMLNEEVLLPYFKYVDLKSKIDEKENIKTSSIKTKI